MPHPRNTSASGNRLAGLGGLVAAALYSTVCRADDTAQVLPLMEAMAYTEAPVVPLSSLAPQLTAAIGHTPNLEAVSCSADGEVQTWMLFGSAPTGKKGSDDRIEWISTWGAGRAELIFAGAGPGVEVQGECRLALAGETLIQPYRVAFAEAPLWLPPAGLAKSQSRVVALTVQNLGTHAPTPDDLSTTSTAARLFWSMYAHVASIR